MSLTAHQTYHHSGFGVDAHVELGGRMTTLTMKDEKRLDVIQRVYRSELTVGQAALIMGLSERQCYRVKARVGKAGAQGVVHGNRGRPCKRRLKDSTVRRVLELARGKYQGFNDHHLTEKLKEQESIEMSREKVRRILRGAGIGSPRSGAGLNTEAAEKDEPLKA